MQREKTWQKPLMPPCFVPLVFFLRILANSDDLL